MVKINNNVPKSNPMESTLLHGDFSTFHTNIVTPKAEIVPGQNNVSTAADAMSKQDTNTKLLIKSLNNRLKEIESPDNEPSKVYVQFNPKEFSFDE